MAAPRAHAGSRRAHARNEAARHSGFHCDRKTIRIDTAKARLTNMNRYICSLLSHSCIFSVLCTANIFAADGKLEALEELAFKQAAALVDPSLVRIETVGGLEQVGEVTLGTGPTSG